MKKIKQFLNYILIGVLTIIPVAIVLQVVLFFKNLVHRLFFGVYGYSESYPITFLAFALTFALFWFVGYETKHHKNYLIRTLEYVIDRIPLLNSVYRVSKKLLSMIQVGEREKDHREVVYIEYPKEGLWVPGYVTNKEGEMYVIYVPTSPNPTSGFTVIVHQSKVIHSKMDLEEVTSFIVSVGVDYDKSDEARTLPTRAG
ncbi:MAG: DUF502 domain-containing protein [Gammaproteobacteria bacterium]